MTWLLTATGATVDLRWLRGGDISLLDIAHHLAQLNRFTGACVRPYSVAEHSLLVCEIAERERGIRSPSVLLAALMHDAHEAYTVDVSSHMKEALIREGFGSDIWDRVESRIAWQVQSRFKIHTASITARADIKWCDLTALSTERAQLLPPSGPDWPCTASHPPVTWVRLADRAAMGWQDWRQAFLDKFAELTFARDLQHEVATADNTAERPAA